MQTDKPMQVEVFKTSIDNDTASSLLKNVLLVLYPGARVNVDLDDCDKILRIEASELSVELVSDIVLAFGYECSLLT